MIALPHTVTVLPASSWTSDSEGNAVRSPDAPRTYKGRLYQQTTSEVRDERTVETVTWKLMLPASAVIGPHDRVQVDDVIYEVDGQPYAARGTRNVHHIQARLTVST